MYDTLYSSQLLPEHNESQLGAHLANSMDAASEGDLLANVLHRHGLELGSLLTFAVSRLDQRQVAISTSDLLSLLLTCLAVILPSVLRSLLPLFLVVDIALALIASVGEFSRLVYA